ncbi:hypothetical protein IL306_009071 [Fusarium sp. DS 682]|nr:hypothetical protein IL306_009071 [Fusarium sp. DS 682]
MSGNQVTIRQVFKRLQDENPADARVLQEYIAQTKNVKDTLQAVVKDIMQAKNDLGLSGENAAALNRCREELCYAVDEHNRVTKDGYERTFHPRFTCRIHCFKTLGVVNGEDQVEVVLRIPARKYNDSPHVLEPGKSEVSLLVKENN